MEILKILHMSDVDLMKRNELCQTILHRATVQNCAEIIRFLTSIDFDVNCVDESGRTPLHYCWRRDSFQALECAILLLENNANVNAQDNDGDTICHRVLARYKYKECSENPLDFLKVLLKFHLNPNIQNKDGETALHMYFKNIIKKQLMVK